MARKREGDRRIEDEVLTPRLYSRFDGADGEGEQTDELMFSDEEAARRHEVLLLSKSTEGHTLSRHEILDLAEKTFDFCQTAAGVTLYPFQAEFGRRIIQSLLLEDGEEITALFARQSGKTETVAVIVTGCMVLLPKLAEFIEDSRIKKFKNGLWVGIFGPSYEIASIMHTRMASRMASEAMAEVFEDPDIDMDRPKGRKMLNLPNGSFVDCNSASPQTHIEGKTYHLIICEETQEITNYKLRKSIHPMGAATNATMIKIGTPHPKRNDFYDACERGRRKSTLKKKGELATHFEFDYIYASRSNPRYAQYMKKEIERLGYDSDDFRMSYRLHWILERGRFVAPEIFDKCGISQRDTLTVKRRGKTYKFTRPDYPATFDRTNENLVAGLDIGRASDSTILTVGRVWWDNPIIDGSSTRYYVHVMNWLELVGDDHEKQYPQILKFLENYTIGKLVIDATGKGDPIYSRLKYDLVDHEIDVVPFVFSTSSKHNLYSVLYREIFTQRLTFPSGEGARRLRKWTRFMEQMYDLEKDWRGKFMDVHAPDSGKHKKATTSEGYHDDYPDSLALMCWAANGEGKGTIETGENQMFGQAMLTDKLSQGRAWFGEHGRRGRERGLGSFRKHR